MPEHQQHSGGQDSTSSSYGVKHFLDALSKGQSEIRAAVNATQLQLARLDERQQETTRKVDAMAISMTNHYVGGIEFGLLKKEVLDYKLYADKEMEKIWDRLNSLEEARESDRTWFIRTILGGIIVGVLSLIGVKKGVF